MKKDNVTEPTALRVGKQTKKRIKQLRKGKGKLARDVDAAVEEALSKFGPVAEGKEIVPVVLVYKEKPKKRKSKSLVPLMPPINLR